MAARYIATDTELLHFPAHDEQKTDPNTKRTFKSTCVGITCGFTAGLFFSMCGATVKYLDSVTPTELALYQSIAISCFSLPFAVWNKENIFGMKSTLYLLLIFCGALDAITDCLTYMSFQLLPLADAATLTSSVPVFVTIAARMFLKERCGKAQASAVVISVFGVLIVSKVPMLMFATRRLYTKEFAMGVLAAVGSIFSESASFVILRRASNVDTFVVLFNCGWSAAIVSAILTAALKDFVISKCGLNLVLIVVCGVFSFLSQLTFVKALEVEEAGPVSVLMAAGDIVLSFALNSTLFSDKLDGYTISGTILVISSVFILGLKEKIDKKLENMGLKEKFSCIKCK